MKAEELRIGNYVIYERTDHVIIEISRDGVKHLWKKDTTNDIYESGLHEIEGIPITKEWLVKFGFGRSEEDEMGCNTSDIGFYYDYHFGRLTIDTGNDDVIIPHIKLVHQLQNLYFALTGTELTIKP